jgi:predicted Zn-dependent peptidase
MFLAGPCIDLASFGGAPFNSCLSRPPRLGGGLSDYRFIVMRLIYASKNSRAWPGCGRLGRLPGWAPLLLLVGLFWVTVGLRGEDGFAAIQSRVTEFTLDNGMKFIVLGRHQAPVASFYTYADVGSAQETKGITGLAHVFEHMAFKGSDRLGTTNYRKERAALDKVDAAFDALRQERQKGRAADETMLKQLAEAFAAAQAEAGRYVVREEFSEVVERAGGRGLNAGTGADSTVYFFSLPANEMELWFYLESERFRFPVLREFYKEKDVVMEERRLRVESYPIGKLIEEFLAVAYKAHPYGEPGIGHMSDLEYLSRADAEAFFRKHYVPGNLTAVVVGDVDPAAVGRLARRYFGRLPRGPLPEVVRTVEPPQDGERRVTLRLQAQRLILVGYHKPDINHPDHAVYEAIGSLLSEGRSSRLYRSLVRDQKLAVAAGGFPGIPGQKYPGLFLFYALTAPGHTNEEVEQALDKEISRLLNAPVNAEELDGVKRRARAALIRSLDDNAGLAGALASWQVLTGDWRNLFRQLDGINAVTPVDVQRVTRATFTARNRTVGLIEPLATTAAQ